MVSWPGYSCLLMWRVFGMRTTTFHSSCLNGNFLVVGWQDEGCSLGNSAKMLQRVSPNRRGGSGTFKRRKNIWFPNFCEHITLLCNQCYAENLSFSSMVVKVMCCVMDCRSPCQNWTRFHCPTTSYQRIWR